MVSLVNELIDTERADPAAVDVLTATGDIADGVTTAFIGDRAVIHDRGNGTIVALDVPGCRIWRHLANLGEDDDVDLRGPVEARFVAQLSSMGLLTDNRGLTE